MMPITHSDLMAITIPSDADHRRSEATLGCSYLAEVIGIRQSLSSLLFRGPSLRSERSDAGGHCGKRGAGKRGAAFFPRLGTQQPRARFSALGSGIRSRSL